MSRTVLRRALAAAAALAWVSCGGGGGAGGGGGRGGGPIPFNEICATYVEDLCTALVQCDGTSYKTVEQCRGERGCPGWTDLQQEVAAGWAEYSPEAAGACHAKVASDYCAFARRFFGRIPTLPRVLGLCPGVLVGHRAVGETCISDGDCAPDAFCNNDDDQCGGVCKTYLAEGATGCGVSGESCHRPEDFACVGVPGACRPRATKVGDFCTASIECHAPDLWCDKAVGKCAAAHRAGEPCNELGASCVPGLHCAAELGEDGVCQPPSRAGESCFTPRDCAPGLACSNPLGGACVEPGKVGGSCQSRECDRTLNCNAAQVCEAWPSKGQPCGGDVPTVCAPGLACTSDGPGFSRSCREERYLGESCEDPFSVCLFSLCRDGRCVAKVPLGGACATIEECRPGHNCIDGACQESTICWGR